MTIPPNPVITRLIDEAVSIVGSQGKLGKAAGFSQNAIWHARRCGRVSADMAVGIEKATQGGVSRESLRPDLFCPVAIAANPQLPAGEVA